jgi:bifunctional pyridoxal-dependent enzyme with beta-cystathionase and maltose regulon repressor activities
MICLCNPLNPTGKVFTREELQRFAEIAIRHDVLILSDEIWSDIVYAPHTYTSMASLGKDVRDRTITITGFSKSYGLAGLRIGAVMASNREHYNLLLNTSLHKSTVHGANLLSQVAAAAALNECAGWLHDFLQHLQRMRDLCVNGLNAIQGVRCGLPEGCYVAFPDITGTGLSSGEMQELLFNEARVAVVPGLPEWFGDGANGHIRLSFATSAEILTQAMERITNTIQRL